MRKKTAVLAMAILLVIGMVMSSCTPPEKGNVLLVDLGSLMPTSNTVSTVDNPEVIQASRYIAEAYAKEKGVNIDWATSYGRSIGSTLEETAAWYSSQIQTGNCPVIGFTSLNMFQERGYYVTLDEYLERPNPYVAAGEPGSVRWKDMFYDYVWEDGTIQNIKGEIVAIPILLSAGTQTAIYYNKSIFEEAQADTPKNWTEFVSLCAELERLGYNNTIAPSTGYTTVGLYQWAMAFNLTPGVLSNMTQIDYDENGIITDIEVLRGVKEGKFDPTVEGAAREVYYAAYDYYVNTLPSGWTNYDYKTNWDSGRLPMVENGLWQIPMENSNIARNFDYGIFTPPIADKTTPGYANYAADIEYYDTFDEIKCPVSVAFNIMKPAVDKNPEKLEQAIDFLMYLTTITNNSVMAEEKGGTKGAVKGSAYNTLIDDTVIGWKSQQFPKVSYASTWPTGYTSDQSSIINKSFANWVSGKMRDNDFFATLHTAQQTGADTYIKVFNIDTSGWDI